MNHFFSRKHGQLTPAPLASALLTLMLGGSWLVSPCSLDAQDKLSSSPPVSIQIGDQKVGEYHADLKGTPAIYPLLTPHGIAVTRNYPVTEATEHERDDHPHHRSLWFTHGEVNGIDFWAYTKVAGHVQQTSLELDEQADSFTVQSTNDWVGPEGERVLKDLRRLYVHQDKGDNVIDFSVRLIASDGDVLFGDTKEGSFGVRVAGKMKVDSKLGGSVHNAEGLRDGEAWGKVSSWVDYSGPCGDDSKAGITIMAHPESDLPETYWHVRTYGLFAANPFGRRHFGQPKYDGYRLAAGESIDLHYRVIVHDGDFDEQKTVAHYRDYLQQHPAARLPPKS